MSVTLGVFNNTKLLLVRRSVVVLKGLHCIGEYLSPTPSPRASFPLSFTPTLVHSWGPE